MSVIALAAIGIGLVIAAWATLLRIGEGSWLAPGAFFALWWAIFATFPLILAPEEPVSLAAMGWVLLASVAVGVGAVAGAGRRGSIEPPVALGRLPRRWFWLTLALATLLGFVSDIAFVTGNGTPITSLLSLDGLIQFATIATTGRYEMEAPPALSQAFLPFVYLAPMLGGILFGETRGRVRWWTVLSVVPGILITVTQTAKAGSLISLLLFIAGYCGSQVRQHRRDLFSWRRVVPAFLLIGGLTLFMYFATLSRAGEIDPALLDVANNKLRSAAIGHMAVFSDWLQTYGREISDPSWGKYTFSGPASSLGLTTRIGGLFETTYFLSFGESSNIYTAFRPLIQDFTIPGALVFLLLLGLIGGIGYRATERGRWWAVPQLIVFYAITIWSPITWLLIYNSQIAAVVGLVGVVLCAPALAGRWPAQWLRGTGASQRALSDSTILRGNRGTS